MTGDTKIKAEERFPYYWSRVHFRKITGWHRMSKFVLQNPTCQNLTICNAKLYMHY